MSHRIVCPHCHAAFKTAEAPPPGKRVKCPKCKQPFSIEPTPSASAAQAVTPQSSSAAATSSGLGKGVLLLVLGVVLGVGGAGGVYWLMTPKAQSGPKEDGNENRVASQQAAGVGSQAQDRQVTPQPPQDAASPVENNWANQPLADAELPQSELKLLMRLKAEGGAKFLAFSPDGSLLAAPGIDGITLFETGTGKLYRNLPFPIRSDRAVTVEFAPNSLAIAAATAGQFTVWQVSDGKELVSQRADQSDFDPAQLKFAFSPSGTQLVFSDAAHALKVWDLESGRELAVWEGHTAPVRAVTFTPDGRSVVSACSDNDRTVRLWSIHDRAENRVLIDGQAITLLAVAPDGTTLFTGPEVKQWDMSGTGPAVARGTISDRVSYADQMRLLPDGKTLSLCTGETTVLWDLEQQQVRQSQEFPPTEGNAPLKQLVVSPDGQTVALAAESVQLWDLATGQMRTRIKEDQTEFWPEQIAFSADGAVLAVGFADGLINLVPASSAAGGSAVATAKTVLTHDSPVGNVAFNADGRFLVVELLPPVIDPQDPAVRPEIEAIVKANDDQLRELGKQADVQLRTKVLSELNEKLFRALYDRFEPKYHWGDVAGVWDLSSGQERLRLKQPIWSREEFLSPNGLNGFNHELGEHRNRVPTVTVGGDRLAWLNRLAGMQLYDVITDRQLQIDSTAAGPLQSEAGRISGHLESWQLSPNGDVLVVSYSSRINSAGGTTTKHDCYLVDLATGQTVTIAAGSKNPLRSQQFCFSPDGVSFAAALDQADGTHTIRVWDVATGREPTPPLSMVSTRPRDLTISPDGQFLAFVDDQVEQDGLHLVDLITGKAVPAAVPQPIAMPTFSPDNQTLALTQQEGERQTILLVDLKTGQVRTRVTDFISVRVGELLFSGDGKSLVVVSGDPDRSRPTHVRRQQAGGETPPGELKVFDVATGNLRAALGGHTSEISDIACSPDGTLLVSSSRDKTVRLWDLNATATESAVVSRTVPRPPTKSILAVTAPPTKPGRPVGSSAEIPEVERTTPRSAPVPSEETAAGLNTSNAGAKKNVNSIGMEFVVIPAGEFQMGSPETDPAAEPYERPAHRVHISRPFAIGKYEVTVGQFRIFVQESGHETDAERDGVGGFGYDTDARQWGGPAPRFTWKNIGAPQTDDHPVVNVSWRDAKAFCSWISTKEGKTYRLPTEAEWEYACRAGTKTRFWTGDRINTLEGAENVGDASLERAWNAATWVADWDDGQPFTAPVGSLKANPWGLFDMHGNATEWTEDWFDENFYERSPAEDPTGPTTGDRPVHRGGNWYTPPAGARSAIRFALASPSDRSDGWGFRVVRVP